MSRLWCRRTGYFHLTTKMSRSGIFAIDPSKFYSAGSLVPVSRTVYEILFLSFYLRWNSAFAETVTDTTPVANSSLAPLSEVSSPYAAMHT